MTLLRRSAMPCRPGPTMWTPSCAASRWAASSRRGSGGGGDVGQAGAKDMADQIAALRSALERVKAGGLSKAEQIALQLSAVLPAAEWFGGLSEKDIHRLVLAAMIEQLKSDKPLDRF